MAHLSKAVIGEGSHNVGAFFESVASEQKEQNQNDEMNRHIKEFEYVVLDRILKIDLIKAKSQGKEAENE